MKGLNQSGITLVEVMITLAISGVLFVLFWGVFVRYSSQESNRQGINKLTSELNETLNDVRNGDIASLGDDLDGILCQERRNSGEIEYRNDPTSEVSDNNNCEFLGQVLHLGENEGSTKITQEVGHYGQYVLIGLEESNENGLNEVEVLKGDIKGTNPLKQIDTYRQRPITNTVGIEYAYYLENGNQSRKPNNQFENMVFIDGIAVVLRKYGPINDEKGNFVGGARDIAVLPLVNNVNNTLNNKQRKSPDRPRLTKEEFVDKVADHSFKPRQIFFKIEGVSYPIYICTISPVGRGLITIGSFGGSLKARADFTKESIDNYCLPGEDLT